MRLAYLAMLDPEDSGPPGTRVTASRPDIVDRNGEVLATDIKTSSLFAEPRKIIDADEAIEKIATVIPDLDYEQTYHKLKSGTGFVWLRRQLSPKQQSDIMNLGIPGIGFRTEKRRFYPGGATMSHIIGLTNIDNQGIAGMESYVDYAGPVRPAGLGPGGGVRPAAGQAVDRPARPAYRARRDRRRDGPLSRHRRRRRRAQRQDRRSGGDGVRAGLRSQQPVQRARTRIA